ncbi:MAG: hypothetical protein IJW66_03995 [Clostridia bacterium]|nr:hypothetical protein [Clostridia bacterium]
MIVGKRYFNNDVFYTVFKKHYCPNCATKLTRIKVSKIVNYHSPEAKNYDFTLGDSFMVGDVKFIWKEFFCPLCKKQIPIKEMKQIEREQKAKSKRHLKD